MNGYLLQGFCDGHPLPLGLSATLDEAKARIVTPADLWAAAREQFEDLATGVSPHIQIVEFKGGVKSQVWYRTVEGDMAEPPGCWPVPADIKAAALAARFTVAMQSSSRLDRGDEADGEPFEGTEADIRAVAEQVDHEDDRPNWSAPFDLAGCYALDENRRVGRKYSTLRQAEESLRYVEASGGPYGDWSADDARRLREEVERLRPFWFGTKEQAVAHYLLANPTA